MKHPDPTASASPTGYRCPACSRSFIALDTGAARHHEVLCACGAVLRAETLPRGVYELRSAEPTDDRVTEPPGRIAGGGTGAKTPDLGYGESHGYGPSHGGPTGPGDAPADPKEEGAPKPSRGLDEHHP